VYCNYFALECNKTHFYSRRNEFDKVVIVRGSDNAGVWGWIPQPLKANRGSEAEHSTLRRFLQFFFQKIRILSIFWS